jgi:hypothetical protein
VKSIVKQYFKEKHFGVSTARETPKRFSLSFIEIALLS